MPPTELGTKQTSKGERTRQLLLDQAMNEIADVGVDRLSFTAIAKRASLTTGSLYSRYENQRELLVDVWQSRCESSLRSLFRLVTRSLTLDGSGSREELARVLADPPRDLCVAVEMAVVARRIDELGEVAIPWLVSEIRDGTLVSETDQFQYIAGIIVGVLLVLSGNSREELDWTEFCSVSFASWAAMPTTQKVSLPKVSLAMGGPLGLDEVDERLVRSTLEVVAKTGFEHATVSRIARRSGINPASLYQRYRDKEALLLHAIEVAVTENIKTVARANSSLLADPGTDFLIVGMALASELLEPQHKQARQIRLELHIASNHNEKIGAYIMEQTKIILDADVTTMGMAAIGGFSEFRPFAVAMRGLLSGLAAFKELGVLDAGVQPSFILATDSTVVAQILSVPDDAHLQ